MRMQQRLALVGAIIVTYLFLHFPCVVVADVVVYKDGRKVEGKITAEEKGRVQLLVKKGKMQISVWISRKEIERIEKGPSVAEQFQQRLAKLDPADLDGHKALLEWAREKRLVAEAQALGHAMPEVARLHLKATHPRTWCRNCDARGKVFCKKCKGTGKVLVPCKRCNGTGTIVCPVCGHLADKGHLKCKKCGGSGKIERFDPATGHKEKVTCPECHGTGKFICPQCHGTGRAECPVCKGKKGVWKTCPVCNGKPEHVCEVCLGTGIQPTPVSDAELAKEKAAAKTHPK